MANSLTRWLRREPVAAGRHVRVMPATTVPGAAPALVAVATQAVLAAESEHEARALAEPVGPLPVPERAPEPTVAEVPAQPVPAQPDPEEPRVAVAPEAVRDAAEPVVAPVEQPAAPVLEPVAAEPPPFEPPPWDLPAPAAPPVPAADPVPATPFGRYEPHPVALEFSDGARFELDEDDPRFESFLAAAAAVTGAAHGPA